MIDNSDNTMGDADLDQRFPVAAIFGWSRRAACGSIVDVFILSDDDIEVRISPNTPGVQLVSNPAKRRREQWYLYNTDLTVGTIIRLRTRVGVRGSGADTERSIDALYMISPDAPVRDITVPGVGYKQFPLLRGPLLVVQERTIHDTIEDHLEGIFCRQR